jgi:hypothetical protein
LRPQLAIRRLEFGNRHRRFEFIVGHDKPCSCIYSTPMAPNICKLFGQTVLFSVLGMLRPNVTFG